MGGATGTCGLQGKHCVGVQPPRASGLGTSKTLWWRLSATAPATKWGAPPPTSRHRSHEEGLCQGAHHTWNRMLGENGSSPLRPSAGTARTVASAQPQSPRDPSQPSGVELRAVPEVRVAESTHPTPLSKHRGPQAGGGPSGRPHQARPPTPREDQCTEFAGPGWRMTPQASTSVPHAASPPHAARVQAPHTAVPLSATRRRLSSVTRLPPRREAETAPAWLGGPCFWEP